MTTHNTQLIIHIEYIQKSKHDDISNNSNKTRRERGERLGKSNVVLQTKKKQKHVLSLLPFETSKHQNNKNLTNKKNVPFILNPQYSKETWFPFFTFTLPLMVSLLLDRIVPRIVVLSYQFVSYLCCCCCCWFRCSGFEFRSSNGLDRLWLCCKALFLRSIYLEKWKDASYNEKFYEYFTSFNFDEYNICFFTRTFSKLNNFNFPSKYQTLYYSNLLNY